MTSETSRGGNRDRIASDLGARDKVAKLNPDTLKTYRHDLVEKGPESFEGRLNKIQAIFNSLLAPEGTAIDRADKDRERLDLLRDRLIKLRASYTAAVVSKTSGQDRTAEIQGAIGEEYNDFVGELLKFEEYTDSAVSARDELLSLTDEDEGSEEELA